MANALIRYKNEKKRNSWARWLVRRTMRENKNNLISVVGQTGSGKTYSAMSICETMGKLDGVHFGIEHIVFDLGELMELINLGTLKRGSKIVFDEPQASIGARDFQSKANKVFNLLVSTFRHKNLTLFFCTPFESLLDKNTRKLFHARFETLKINKKENTCRLKPRYIEYSDFKTEPYRKQMIVFFKDKKGTNKIFKMFHWDVHKPSDELIELYEKKKTDFTSRLNKNILEEVKDPKNAAKNFTLEHQQERKDLTEKQKHAMKVFANIKESNKYEKASEILGITVQPINQHIKLSKKKGYTLEEFREDEK